MLCALHVVVAFGVLLVVCSLVRANAVRLRVQLRPSPVQIFRPSCRFLFFFSFLSVAKPRSPRQFSPAVGTRCCLHVFHVALSVCRACLGEVPAWFFPFLYSSPCSPALQTKASKSRFPPACIPQERGS